MENSDEHYQISVFHFVFNRAIRIHFVIQTE